MYTNVPYSEAFFTISLTTFDKIIAFPFKKQILEEKLDLH